MEDDLTVEERAHLRKLVKWIQEQLSQGRKRDEVIRDLAGTGISTEMAVALVDGVTESSKERETLRPSIAWFTSGWVAVALVFLGLNGLLYFGQEWYHLTDVRRCEAIERHLAELDQEIASMEMYLEGLEREREAISDLESKLERAEREVSTESAYNTAYHEYSDRVDQYNEEVESANVVHANYERTIASYNELVDEYNELAKFAYSRWYLIPVPRGRAASMARRANSTR